VRIRIRRALISVSDKADAAALGRQLSARGVQIVSTGGTARLLAEAGVPVQEVEALTGFPEMLDGRVKTLHPRVHAALLARRDRPEHMAALGAAGIEPIDLLVVNLYPFTQTVARADCSLDDAIENIDIGGPAMLRGAAKNFGGVAVLIDPADYGNFLQEMDEHQGTIGAETRYRLACKVFSHTAAYDGAISNYLSGRGLDSGPTPYPARLSVQLRKVQDLRYGENPHQSGAFYADFPNVPAGTLALFRQLQGKELSYNNIADADAAWECVKTFARTTCVIVKHANPCGVSEADDAHSAYTRAFATDPTSAFGGIIAFNCAVDRGTARAVSSQFVELVIAPDFAPEACVVFAEKPNIRLLQIPLHHALPGMDFKRVGGGMLVQSADTRNVGPGDLTVVTRRAPTSAEMADLLFAWRVAKYVKSNAIVFAGGGATLGVGAGQMSRIDSARIAAIKAGQAGLSLAGSAAASDAFFPFRDGLDVLAQAGARAVIQPGGSMRDDSVIAAANEHDVAMVLTGVRHFRH
jgi:phosphoribosylaminoimidazolecarboxamide formyltransferase/IMP cyclohydrolase